MKNITINANGLAQIRAAIELHTDQPVTDSMVHAYASDVESNWIEGESVQFEIKKATRAGTFGHVITGPLVVEIDQSGFDVVDIEE